MNVIRTYVPNSFANYNHIVYCSETGEAAAVDPFDAQHLLTLAQQHKLALTQIWITHEHGDHIRQLSELQQATGAIVYAPETCRNLFNADVWLKDEQNIALGNKQIKHWLSPGHTPGHGVFSYQSKKDPMADFIICGDTLFNAGVGNTRSGNTSTLYRTIARLSAQISPSSKIYSGHDYLVTNLKFSLHHCPILPAATELLATAEQQTPETRTLQRFEQEQHYNLFLRLSSPEVIELTGISGDTEADREARFKHLRTLRDQW